MKIQASIIILTKNETLHIKRAVNSAHDFAEVLVVDSSSTDDTCRLAENAGAKIIQFDWNGAYPKKKEWALTKAAYDWVIYLDADEYLTESLVAEIRSTISAEISTAFEVPLKYFWLGKELRHGHRVSKRIGIRTSQSTWPRPDDLDVKNMWEVEGHYQPEVLGNVAKLSSPLGHDDQDGLYDYFSRHNRYSDWEASMLTKKDQESLSNRSYLGRIAANLPAKSTLFLIYSYILRGGFLDGRSGWEYARALSFYYWQIEVKRRELTLAASSHSNLDAATS
ncbi:glycosyltransferase family 2 protein [Cryobacterium sp. PH31-O1]|uniref:glycosyltransferase family 2 protein n=1 Tax=Cryobacterium sp. PH31-O1 TaxID=3046306 RepID=UPI0024B8F095|nr:glycosyltransferase family 2 protein [Cryobacterium sp. PH31-O1]MDJ0338357.1 glycosyltransferase family 2 protein [Cryobacterium sp. PH31-O1]